MPKRLKLYLPSLSPYSQIVDKIIKRRLGFNIREPIFTGLVLTGKKIGLLIKAMPSRERVYYLQKLHAHEIERLDESLTALVAHANLPEGISKDHLLDMIHHKLTVLFPRFGDDLIDLEHIYYNNMIVISRDFPKSMGHGKSGQKGPQKVAINFACTARGQLVELGIPKEMTYATRKWLVKKELKIGAYILNMKDNLTFQLVRVLFPEFHINSGNKKCAVVLLKEALRAHLA